MHAPGGFKTRLNGKTLVAGCAITGALLYAAWAFHFSPEARAEALLSGYLIDPGSVQLRKVRTSAVSSDSICGEVNAKNRMGGYVGFRRFIASRSAVEVESEDGPGSATNETFIGLWAVYCK